MNPAEQPRRINALAERGQASVGRGLHHAAPIGDKAGRNQGEALMTEETAKLDLELARVVLRQGELRLQDQLARALASDQRATTLAGLFTAAAMAALGFGASVLGQRDADLAIGIGSLGTGTLLLAGVGLCVAAAWPVPFAAAGAAPEKWWKDGVETRPLAECLKKESRNYQRRIEHNRAVHARATQWLRAGIVIGCSAPALGLVVWALVSALV